MIYPSIDDLLSRVDSRYSLVILAAKRARQLREMQGSMEEGLTLKEVSAALEEIAKGHVTFERTKDGIK
ncbi:MAG TPA: DNA-directed RNA polymerase subunit omega [Firmicutes bacterium]|nr:DNA-directed RNA polymerase subunit omega [Bacillota bacterium]